MSKVDLKVSRAFDYDDYSKYSINFELQNNDTSAIPLSSLRVVGYLWSQNDDLNRLTFGVNNSGLIKRYASADLPQYPGIGQNGIVQLNNTSFVYRVEHSMIDSSKISPIVSLNIPANGSYIAPISITNRTDYYFDIVITEVPPTVGYSVSWYIPATTETYSGVTTAISSPVGTFVSVTESVRVDSRKSDTKFIFSWTDNTAIPSGCALISANYYIKPTSGYFFNSSIPSNSWFSKLQSSEPNTNDPYFVVEQYIGSSWVPVSEVDEFGVVDNITGFGPSTLNQLNYTSGTSVYIQSGISNPISASLSDKNILKIGSVGYGECRSLIKFETLSIPSSATSIRNAILRLNVNALNNGWLYTGTSGHVSVHRLLKNWTENQATWTNATSSVTWSAVGGEYTSSNDAWVGNTNLVNNFTSASSNSQFFVDVNVTDIVEYWRVNPSQNYGFLVKLAQTEQEQSVSAVNFSFNSSRSTSASPQLLISYNSPNPNGAVPVVSIKSPENNDTILGTSCNISVDAKISTGVVTNVDIFYKDAVGNDVYVGSCQNVSNEWIGLFDFGSIVPVQIFARATSDLGVYGYSEQVNLIFDNVNVPKITPMGAFCHSGSFTISGTYTQAPKNITVSYGGGYIPSDVKITDIAVDKTNSNIVWIATFGNGLWRYDKSANSVTNYTKENSPLPSNYINTVAITSSKYVFINCRYADNLTGLGVVSFDTAKWNSYVVLDWKWFNKTNSVLSEYSSIDVKKIVVDSSDSVWFGMSETYNQVMKMVGVELNNPFVKKYSIHDNSHVLSLTYENNKIVVGTDSNVVETYLSTSDTFTKSTSANYKNIKSVAVDSSGNLWTVFDNAIGYYKTSTSAWQYVVSENTPSWPNGLSSGSNHFKNSFGTFVATSGTNKLFGFSTNNGQMNGGLVRYSGSSFDTSAISSSSNWVVYDKDTNYSLISNDVNCGVVSNNDVWVGSSSGVFNNTSGIWRTPSKDSIEYVTNYSNSNWYADITKISKTDSISIDFQFENNTITSAMSLSAGNIPTIDLVYPYVGVSLQNSVQDKLFEYDINNIDYSRGESASCSVYRSANSSGPWNLYLTSAVTKNIKIYDTLVDGQSVWYYLNVVTDNGCSAISSPVIAYKNNAPTGTINVPAGVMNSSSKVLLSGTFSDPDFGKLFSNGSDTLTDSVSSVSLSSNKGNVGQATITRYQTNSTPGYWEFEWLPIPSATSVSAAITDSFGKSAIVSTSFSSVLSSPSVSILGPTSGQSFYQSNTLALSASAVPNPGNTISSVVFYISGTSASYIGPATLSSGKWVKSVSVSSAISAFNNVGGSYSIFASAVDNVGLTAVSEKTPISVNILPEFTLSNPVGPACHNGSFDLVGYVDDSDSSTENIVQIYRSGSLVTSGLTTNHKLTYTWSNPPTGVFDINVVTRDGVVSADYSSKTFSLSASRIPSITAVNSFPSGVKNGIVVSPKISVVSGGQNLSATYSSTDSGTCNFWYCDSKNVKTRMISANTTSAYVELSPSFGQTTNVLAEYVTVGGCVASDYWNFYTLSPTIILDDFNNCSKIIRFAGTIDFDGISGTNQLIDNVFVAKLYIGGSFISDLTLIQNGTKYSFNYNWTTPVQGTSAITITCENQYGSFAKEISIPTIASSSEINTLSFSGYSKSSNGIFLTTASTINLSSTIVNDVAQHQLIVETEDAISVYYSQTYEIGLSLEQDKLYNLKSIITTNGGCEFISDYISVIHTYGSQGITNVFSNGCENSSISVNGYTGKLINAVGNYDSSAAPNYIKTESVMTSAYELPSNILLYVVSADSLSANSSETVVGFSFDFMPSVGTSGIKLLSNSSIFDDLVFVRKIPTVVSVQTPVLQYSGTLKVSEPITISFQDDSFINSSKIYINGELKSTSKSFVWTPLTLGSYSVSAVVTNVNGCSTNSNILNLTIASAPVGLVVSPSNNSYIMSGTSFDVVVLASPSFEGVVSAVNVYNNIGGLIGSAFSNDTNTWIRSGVQNVSGVYAEIFDNRGMSAVTPVNKINLIYPTTTLVSVNSATFEQQDTVVIYTTASSPNTTIASVEIYEVVGDNNIFISAVDNTFSIQAGIFGQGNHTVVAKSIDAYGAYSFSSPISFTVNSLVKNSFPTITYISSDPENRVTSYGNVITSEFTISDINYGILSASISSNGTIKSITSLNGDYKYSVTVEVSGTCNLTLSATNKIGNYKSETIYNYIFACEENRDLNLTNYIPGHLIYDETGNTSELYTLTKFYENYLNTLYTSLDEPCSIGVLEKTSRLRNLHDPDKMELDYIQFFANYLGYNVDVNKSELGGFTTSPESSAYDDGPDNAEVFSEYQKKALRFVVRNLPNWYSIKTTRNSIKMLLLSFGIFGDLLEVYTNDYTNDWVINSIPPGTYVANDMDPSRYPTPHMFVEIDINNTNLENLYGSEQNLTSVYKSFDAIRPVNVVFEGILGKVGVTTEPIYTVNASCMMEKDFIISLS